MRILIATDLSSYSDTAIAAVQAMPLPPGSEVRLVHAVEPVPTVAIFAPPEFLTMNEATERELRAILRDQAKKLEHLDRKASAIVGFGRAADVIIDESQRFSPDLIVVGSRGRGAVASSVLGSVSAEVIDRAACPVLVARRTTLSTIVLAEDGSVDAGAGAACIVALEPLSEAAVHVVSVVDEAFPIVLADPTGTATAMEAYRAYENAMPRLVARSTALAQERADSLARLGIRATVETRKGDAAGELIAAATEHGADCIVIGSRGETGLRRLMLGSVARSVLFHAPCSVLIAHAATSSRKEVSHVKEPVPDNGVALVGRSPV